MDCLVDTSVWMDFFNGAENAGVERLTSLLNHGEVATSPVILMEVFQGIRSDQTCKQVQQQLACLNCYPIADERYSEAAHLYRQLRKQGVTVRKSIDCLIASVALYFKLPVLHRDRDPYCQTFRFDLLFSGSALKGTTQSNTHSKSQELCYSFNTTAALMAT